MHFDGPERVGVATVWIYDLKEGCSTNSPYIQLVNDWSVQSDGNIS
jgi:hypothetical protein